MPFFSNSVNTLGIVENKLLLNPVSISDVGVEKCIKMYETHPSIVNIGGILRLMMNFISAL